MKRLPSQTRFHVFASGDIRTARVTHRGPPPWFKIAAEVVSEDAPGATSAVAVPRIVAGRVSCVDADLDIVINEFRKYSRGSVTSGPPPVYPIAPSVGSVGLHIDVAGPHVPPAPRD